MRADALRSRDAIIDAAAEVLRRDGAEASLEEIARRAGVGSATLHRHFRGRRALIEAVFVEQVEHLCRVAGRLGEELPPDEALWAWLREIAHHCAQEKSLLSLVRASGPAPSASDHSVALLERAGEPLLERARAVGAVRPAVTITELLLLVNAVADLGSSVGADVDRLLDLSWDGARPGSAP